MASLTPSSCIHHGSPKDPHTSLASFLQSSTPGTVDSSVHHSGVLHLSALHGTHQLNSKTVGSRGIFLPSSLEVSGNPLSKEATAGFSSGSFSKSEPSLVDLFSLGSFFGSGGPQTSPDGVSFFAPPYFILGSPYSWILPSVLNGSGCDLASLSPPQG